MASLSKGEGWTFRSRKGKNLRLAMKDVSDETLLAIKKKWDDVIPNVIVPKIEAALPDSLVADAEKAHAEAVDFRPWSAFMARWKRAAGGNITGHKPIWYYERGTVKTPGKRIMAKTLRKLKAELLAPLNGILK